MNIQLLNAAIHSLTRWSFFLDFKEFFCSDMMSMCNREHQSQVSKKKKLPHLNHLICDKYRVSQNKLGFVFRAPFRG